MLRTPTTVKAVAVLASGVLHAAAFAAAAPRADQNRGQGGDFEVPFVVEDAEDAPARSPLLEPPQTPARPASAPVRSSARTQLNRPASEPHAPASELRASASAEVASTEAPPVIGRSRDGELPRFVMVLGAATNAGTGVGAGGESGGTTRDDESILPVEEATTPARLLAAIPPRYPIQGRANSVEADVKLEIVVDSAGRVQSPRVLGAPKQEFDEAALAAVANYRFVPAMLKGRPVRVRMKWTVEFRLN